MVYLLKLLYANSCVFSGRMARNLFILSIVGVCTVFAEFCTAHCALDLARDHAPYNCPLLLWQVQVGEKRLACVRACEMFRCMAVRLGCERDDACCIFVQLCPKHRPSQAVLRGLWKMEVVSA